MSPPPSLAAPVIARESLVKCWPRRWSTTAFLCLIEAHFECPDMSCHYRPDMNSSIFKAYDIRGVYGDDIDASDAHDIGRAFTRVIAGMSGKDRTELTLGLGRDMRLQAPELAGAYRDGMVAEGAKVLDAGEVGTEMLYYLVGSRDLDGGLMCTASHNPKAYTGAKLVRRGALALSGDSGIGEVRDLVLGGLDSEAPASGSVEPVDVREEFQEAALRFIDRAAIKPLKVVVD